MWGKEGNEPKQILGTEFKFYQEGDHWAMMRCQIKSCRKEKKNGTWARVKGKEEKESSENEYLCVFIKTNARLSSHTEWVSE